LEFEICENPSADDEQLPLWCFFQIENRAREVMFSASCVKGGSQLKLGVPLRSTTQHYAAPRRVLGAVDNARLSLQKKRGRQSATADVAFQQASTYSTRWKTCTDLNMFTGLQKHVISI